MNIIKSLEKEIAKGNNIVLANGTICNEEKLHDALRKDYAKGLKNNTIDIYMVSFRDFVKQETQDILTVTELLEYITGEAEQEEQEETEQESEE